MGSLCDAARPVELEKVWAIKLSHLRIISKYNVIA